MTAPIVKRFLVSFDEHKLIGLCSFALVVGAAGALSMIPPPPPTPPKYEATGTLRFAPPPPIFTQTGEALQQQGQATVTEETLLSDQVLKPVAAQVDEKPEDLVEDVEIVFPKKDDDKKGGGGEPFALEVKYTAKDPQTAGTATGLLMQEMVKQSRAINTALLRAKIDSLKTRLAQAQKEQQVAERAFFQFISQEGASLVAAEDGTLFAGISGAQQQQRQLRLTLEGVQAQIASISSQLGLTPEQAYTSSMLSADPIIGRLRAQLLEIETQMEPLKQKLRPEHPQMKLLVEQKQAAERQLQDRYSELIGTGILTPLPGQIRKESSLDPARQELANTLVNLKTQRDTLISQLESVQRQERELRQQYEKFPTKQLEKSRLQQELQIKQQLYDNMLSSLTDAQSAEAETAGSLTIASPPVLAEIPGESKEGLNPILAVGGGSVAGFLVAGGIIFLFSMLDGRVHSAKEIQAILSDREVPLLGELPLVYNLDADREETPILQPNNRGDLHYYELFRSNLRRGAAKSAKVILVTSEAGNEGKTITAYNLAIASAQAGRRTLLIEADLRSPSECHHLDIEPDPDAQLEPLSYYSSRSDYLQLAPEMANLYIVPSVGPQSKASAVLESSEFRRLVEDARGRFDFVIVDTPSMSSCNDALLAEPLTDGIVLVARPGVTQKAAFGARLDQLIEAELPLLGVAINGVEYNELSGIPFDGFEDDLAELPQLSQGRRMQSFGSRETDAEELARVEDDEEEFAQQVSSS